MLAVDRNQGFRLSFPNGVMASVQFGPGTYSEHHSSHMNPQMVNSWDSRSAEVAAWWADSPQRPAITNEVMGEAGPTQVRGYLSAAEVAEFLDRCAHYPPRA